MWVVGFVIYGGIRVLFQIYLKCILPEFWCYFVPLSRLSLSLSDSLSREFVGERANSPGRHSFKTSFRQTNRVGVRPTSQLSFPVTVSRTALNQGNCDGWICDTHARDFAYIETHAKVMLDMTWKLGALDLWPAKARGASSLKTWSTRGTTWDLSLRAFIRLWKQAKAIHKVLSRVVGVPLVLLVLALLFLPPLILPSLIYSRVLALCFVRLFHWFKNPLNSHRYWTDRLARILVRWFKGFG